MKFKGSNCHARESGHPFRIILIFRFPLSPVGMPLAVGMTKQF